MARMCVPVDDPVSSGESLGCHWRTEQLGMFGCTMLTGSDCSERRAPWGYLEELRSLMQVSGLLPQKPGG